MGAWGTAIFSDDVAADVKGVYRDLLEDKVGDLEARRLTIAQFADLDQEESHILWLALAAAQVAYGRLDDEVKGRALYIIDSGIDEPRWEESSSKDRTARRVVLEKLRTQLTGPQKARSVLRAPWKSSTDLEAGDVLAYASASSTVALIKVIGIHESRYGRDAVFDRLDWYDAFIPEPDLIGQLGVVSSERWLSRSFSPAKGSSRDADWADVGFVFAAKLESDYSGPVRRRRSMRWVSAAVSLESELRARES
ncbi:MAG: hypothetical protein EPO52_11185 [Herbiconiux sp.]|uniref:hypothetical protein n=1 Tax=Herbiconiux sp. TaxID=1871186 RepID=UPI0012160942|nr:hypothetical protein [Herbiconiux sp.]TAJ48666.1 MAG: hypothetical protein EPO52_11185 [Herbiconiux sp.]